MGLLPLLANPLVFLVTLAASAFGLVVHNLFQAWLADRYGDPSPRRFGFLSLEPRVHLDILGLFFLVLLGFGFPRPVPYRLYGGKAARVALMGPLGFFVMAFLYALVARLLLRLGPPSVFGIAEGFYLASGYMLVSVAIFLFPIPPLDGARVVQAVGGTESRRFMDRLASYGPLGFLVIFLILDYTGITGAAVSGLQALLSLLLHRIGL
jgi:Zn-dependent protease